jgi:hypothetical protein
MGAPVLIPDDRTVYRGLSNDNWSKHGIISYKAFMLRPADVRNPIEEELSLGMTPQSAVDELRTNAGTASLSVLAVHGLRHSLTVRADLTNPLKAEMHGLPLHSTEPNQRDLALAVATDVAALALFAPVP